MNPGHAGADDRDPEDRSTTDCVIVGASFAGLACAARLAERGVRVTVVEKKRDPGEKLHTTGILVREAMEESRLLDGIPSPLVRKVNGVRLYSPSLRSVDLDAPGYYFLTTDTPNLMRWLAQRACARGATLRLGSTFFAAERTRDGFDVHGVGHASYLVGADGPHSRVAASLGLGRNRSFLFGVEHEFAVDIGAPDRLHCFIDRKLARGYIGWVVAGVGVTQVGLAHRTGRVGPSANECLARFIDKIAPIFDFRDCPPVAVRAGMIPCGGLVRPATAERVLLLGDAAGMVSPVTAGGIHMALRHGAAAGDAIAAFLSGGTDPRECFVATYPGFRFKRLLRWLYDHFQSDLAFDLLLNTRAVRAAASRVYFHRKAVRPN